MILLFEMYKTSYLREVSNVFCLYRNNVINVNRLMSRTIERQIDTSYRGVCSLNNDKLCKLLRSRENLRRISTNTDKGNLNCDYSHSVQGIYEFPSYKCDGCIGTQNSVVSKLQDSDLASIELERAIQYTQDVLEDPISYITKDESNKFLIPYPKSDMHPLLEQITRPFRFVNCLIQHLCSEKVMFMNQHL